MANYTTVASDKSKKKAAKLVLFGGLGIQYFYAGRIGVGIVRFILGVLFWVLLIDGIAETSTPMIVSGIVAILAINLFELVKIALGRFRDRDGLFLRQ